MEKSANLLQDIQAEGLDIAIRRKLNHVFVTCKCTKQCRQDMVFGWVLIGGEGHVLQWRAGQAERSMLAADQNTDQGIHQFKSVNLRPRIELIT